MKCERCSGESAQGKANEWVAGRVLDEHTTGVQGAYYTVQQTYGDFAPVKMFLCEPCFARARRRHLLICLGGLVGSAVVAPSWVYLLDYLTRPDGFQGELPEVLKVVLAVATIPIVLAPLAMLGALARAVWFWGRGDAKEAPLLLKPYAEKKTGSGRPVLWTLEEFAELKRRDQELRQARRLKPFG